MEFFKVKYIILKDGDTTLSFNYEEHEDGQDCYIYHDEPPDEVTWWFDMDKKQVEELYKILGLVLERKWVHE